MSYILMAFESAPHNRLLDKLKEGGGGGGDGKLPEWFRCFLVDRYQRVHTNGSLSSWDSRGEDWCLALIIKLFAL